jgi:hypothetical protein
MVNLHAQPQVPLPSRDRLGDFQHTKSATFSHAVVQCNNREKVLLVYHQLFGPAADWWDAYREAHEEPESINWPKFRATFPAHHVPQGVIKLKMKEF